MNESDSQRVYNFPVYPSVSNLYSDKGFVNIDNGFQEDSHWTVFYLKNNKSYYFDSFGGAPENLLKYQQPKPIIYHNYKIQDISSQLCGSYCLYFFGSIERMKYNDTVLKMYFD